MAQSALIISAVLQLFAHPPIPGYEGPRDYECPPTEFAELAGLIADIHPAFLDAVIMTESRGRHDAVGDGGKKGSKNGSHGMWQINYHTCKGIYTRCKVTDLYDPVLSSVIAGLLWRHILQKTSRTSAAVAYNCGHKCKKNGKWYSHTKVTRAYFRRFKHIQDGAICEP